MRKRVTTLTLIVCFSIGYSLLSNVQAQDDFYKGKTIRLMIGSTAVMLA